MNTKLISKTNKKIKKAKNNNVKNNEIITTKNTVGIIRIDSKIVVNKV